MGILSEDTETIYNSITFNDGDDLFNQPAPEPWISFLLGPVTDTTMTRVLYPSDWRIWLRFVMSFLINGVGFHILVHALPIQVASQSSLTGVVFRAVGMMYLVDLDDVPGYKLTLVEEAPPEQDEEPLLSTKPDTTSSPSEPDEATSTPVVVAMHMPVVMSDQQLSQEAELILAEARARLDALAKGQPYQQQKKGGISAGGAAILGATAGASLVSGTIPSLPANDTSDAADEGGMDEGGEESGEI